MKQEEEEEEALLDTSQQSLPPQPLQYTTSVPVESIPGDQGITKAVSGTLVISILDFVLALGVVISLVVIVATGNSNRYLLLLIWNAGHVFSWIPGFTGALRQRSMTMYFLLIMYFLILLADIGALINRGYLLVVQCLIAVIDTGTCNLPAIQEIVYWFVSLAFLFVTIGYIGNLFTALETSRKQELAAIHLTLAAKEQQYAESSSSSSNNESKKDI